MRVNTQESVLGFKTTEYGRKTKVVATEEVKNDIREIGIKKCARESGFTRFFVRKLLPGRTVRRNSYNEFVRWLQEYKSQTTGSQPHRILGG
jgi:hypothetical protein